MVVIHAGGVAQLALLGGDPATAFRVGFVPFFTGDLLKVGLAAALILGLRSTARAGPLTDPTPPGARGPSCPGARRHRSLLRCSAFSSACSSLWPLAPPSHARRHFGRARGPSHTAVRAGSGRDPAARASARPRGSSACGRCGLDAAALRWRTPARHGSGASAAGLALGILPAAVAMTHGRLRGRRRVDPRRGLARQLGRAGVEDGADPRARRPWPRKSCFGGCRWSWPRGCSDGDARSCCCRCSSRWPTSRTPTSPRPAIVNIALAGHLPLPRLLQRRAASGPRSAPISAGTRPWPRSRRR